MHKSKVLQSSFVSHQFCLPTIQKKNGITLLKFVNNQLWSPQKNFHNVNGIFNHTNFYSDKNNSHHNQLRGI